MNQQDFDKKKSIPQGKENSLFYKIINRMIISRKALDSTPPEEFLLHLDTHTCVLYTWL